MLHNGKKFYPTELIAQTGRYQRLLKRGKPLNPGRGLRQLTARTERLHRRPAVVTPGIRPREFPSRE